MLKSGGVQMLHIQQMYDIMQYYLQSKENNDEEGQQEYLGEYYQKRDMAIQRANFEKFYSQGIIQLIKSMIVFEIEERITIE